MRAKVIIPLIIVVGLAVAGLVYFSQQAAANHQAFTLSGTIEATEINVATISGGQVKQVYVAEGDQIQKDQALVSLYATSANVNEKVRSPIDGAVLERLVEPDEVAPPGSTVMVVAGLDTLTLKIYVPEDRYGQISLGQTYSVTVDSFPGETFSATVKFISDKAEFTPRNVQTTDSRKTTVYAVRLDLNPTGGKLKPGMPADVHFNQ
ncbi:MAG: efflux RND transporter periplasmic adaptor subunit [Chloroflexi bacterium]|nr:efflux RND transporter periplasmic adaptor subunit [Chloroflexota bacterium]